MKSQNTYSLLVNSEEKNRSIFEGAVYGLVVVSMAFSVFAFARQSINIPGMTRTNSAPAAIVETAPVQPLVAAR